MNFKQLFIRQELSNEEKRIFSLDMVYKNFNKLKFIIPFGIFLSLIFSVIFYDNTEKIYSVEYLWKQGIFYTHFSNLIYFIIIGLFVFFTLKHVNEKLKLKISVIIIDLTYFSVLIVGAMLALFDQYITNSISPFIIVCFILPLVFINSILKTFLFLLSALLLFSILIPNFQYSTNIVNSNIFNAFGVASISFVLSLVLLQNEISKFIQEKVIKNQNATLESQNKQLKLYTEELNQLNTTKDKFFSIIAHDLKNPLGAFRNLTQLFLDDFKTFSDDEKKELVELLNKSSSKVYNLLENLLEWSRSQRGLIKIELENLNIYLMLEETINVFKLKT
jgi:signal transduction histidine kinase